MGVVRGHFKFRVAKKVQLLNRVLALAAGKGGILTSVGWQVTLCAPIWHVSFP